MGRKSPGDGLPFLHSQTTGIMNIETRRHCWGPVKQLVYATDGDRQLIHPRLLKVLMFLGSGEVVT